MRSVAILTAVIALGATSARAQNTPAPAPSPSAQAPLQLEIALRGYAADNRERSLAGDSTTDKIERYVWADRSLCGVGSGNAVRAGTPRVCWAFKSFCERATKTLQR